LWSKSGTTKELLLIKIAFEMNVSKGSEVKAVQEWHKAQSKHFILTELRNVWRAEPDSLTTRENL
jgi:acyl-ACP thioesterase